MRKIYWASAFLLILGALPAMAEADATKGEAVFKRCSACHAVGEGAKNRVGPELNGVINRVIAASPDYNYSPAMKTAGAGGGTWSEEKLREFLTAPRKAMPGNKMAFPGITKADDLDNLLAFLKAKSPAQ